MNTSVMNVILERIKAYDRILLFRHIRLDGDCVGATKGLEGLLTLTYPQKDVRIADTQHSDYLAFLGPDEAAIPDGDFADALAIVIDVGSSNRISDQRYKMCREIIKIDHHIEREPYGHINWVEDSRSSACEMIAAFYETFRDELAIDSHTASCIYTGMVTDSGRFEYEGVKGDTLRLAGLMLDQGIDTERLYAQLYLRDFASLKFKAHIYDQMQVTENGVAYVHITREMQQRFGLTFESASAAISYLSDIRGVLCWLAFIDSDDGAIRVRLRSRFATINTIAEKYRGGGHACASGATVYSADEMCSLIRDADAHIKEYKETHEGWL
ncbi:MAG: bifunctional oligoribonuclease/PAP phosphatase NrnA [Clostridia bacterium]|nr:bifunctional oligoribonuclease/PAP phosphatase NrnA [Clostridia bacterium]